MDNTDTGIEAAEKLYSRLVYHRRGEEDEVALTAGSAEAGPGEPPGPISKQAEGDSHKTPGTPSLDGSGKVTVALELQVPRPERREGPQCSTEWAANLWGSWQQHPATRKEVRLLSWGHWTRRCETDEGGPGKAST